MKISNDKKGNGQKNVWSLKEEKTQRQFSATSVSKRKKK